MPFGISKVALLGGGGGASEHWFGIFDRNSTYYQSGFGSQAIDSSDNIGLVFQGYGSPDGSMTVGSYSSNVIVDKEGTCTWGKALGPTSGQPDLYAQWQNSCAFKGSSAGQFVVQAALPTGGQFANLSPYYASNQPTIIVDINPANGSIVTDRVVYRGYNGTVQWRGILDPTTYTNSGTEYLFSSAKGSETSNSTVGFMRYQCNSTSGFAAVPDPYQKYSSSAGQNLYNGSYMPTRHGVNSSGLARVATVGYIYKSDGYGARFVPYLILMDWDSSNFNQACPYQNNNKGGYYHSAHVTTDHKCFAIGQMAHPTGGQFNATITEYSSTAVQQGNMAIFKSDGTGGNAFTHIREDTATGDFYVAGYLDIVHDSVTCGRLTLTKFNSSRVPQWWRTLDIEPADASSNRVVNPNGLDINSDGNLVVSYVAGTGVYSVGGVAVLPKDGSGTGTYSIDGHTFTYFDSASTITDVSSAYSFTTETRFSNIGTSIASHTNMTPDNRTGANVLDTLVSEAV